MTDEWDPTRVTRSREAARVSYDRLSRWYDLIAGKSERKFTLAGLDRLNVQPGEQVLEIGFGTGHSLIALAHRVGTSGKVYGIDLSEEMVRLAEARLRKANLWERVDLRCGDAANLPYRTDSFDAIFLGFVLELFDTPEIPAVMSQCFRVLHPNGRVAVVALSKKKRAAVRLYEWAHTRFPDFLDCRPIFVRRSVEAAGFRVVDTVELSMWGLPVEIVCADKNPRDST